MTEKLARGLARVVPFSVFIAVLAYGIFAIAAAGSESSDYVGSSATEAFGFLVVAVALS